MMESESDVIPSTHEIVGHEEVTVTAGTGEERLMYQDDQLAGSSGETHQEEVIPSDGVSLIKIVPKQKVKCRFLLDN